MLIVSFSSYAIRNSVFKSADGVVCSHSDCMSFLVIMTADNDARESAPIYRRVWYQLLGLTNEEPLGESSIDRVTINTNAYVFEVRDAIYIKDSRLFERVPISQLHLYESRCSFNKRIHIGERRAPLSPTTQVGSLGESTENPIIVFVPVVGFSQFSPCQIPFFLDILNATETDGSILFNHIIPSTTLKALYVRDCYVTIASSLKPGINKALITGTPGIGKSLFFIYLLWKLVKQNKRILLIYYPYNIYYDGRGGVFRIATRHLPLENDFSFWNETLWCLFDAKHKSEAHFDNIPYPLCTFIMSTSPRRDLIHDFKKPPVPQIFYMPLWAEAELEIVVPLFPNSRGWRKRFTILGGIIRYVLEEQTSSPRYLLDETCTDSCLDDCLELINLNVTMTDKSPVIEFLVHMKSDAPFTEFSVCFSSSTALDIIVQRRGFEARRRFAELLPACEYNPLVAALCERIFKAYAIELLVRGGTFTCKAVANRPEEMTTLTIPPSTKKIAGAVAPRQAPNRLYVSRKSHDGIIDAWIPGIGGFIMTLGKNQNVEGIRDDLSRFGESNRLYWLLPPLHYHSFAKDYRRDIEQYAVLIPYPSRD